MKFNVGGTIWRRKGGNSGNFQVGVEKQSESGIVKTQWMAERESTNQEFVIREEPRRTFSFS